MWSPIPKHSFKLFTECSSKSFIGLFALGTCWLSQPGLLGLYACIECKQVGARMAKGEDPPKVWSSLTFFFDITCAVVFFLSFCLY